MILHTGYWRSKLSCISAFARQGVWLITMRHGQDSQCERQFTSSLFREGNREGLPALPDSHPCYTQVGLIAAEGARIEHLLDQSIAHVAGTGLKIGACFTGQMIGPGPRFSALLQLCKVRELPVEILKRIDKVSGRTILQFEKRNRAVHDPWLEEVGAGTSHQFIGKPKRVAEFGVKPKTDQDLKNDLTELRKSREEVLNLVSDIWTALQPA